MAERRDNPLQVIKAVLWAFLDIRRSEGHKRDAAQVRLPQLIAVALLLAALFVVGLIVLVRQIAS
jgi:hypothetical protein